LDLSIRDLCDVKIKEIAQEILNQLAPYEEFFKTSGKKNLGAAFN
jgi:hypothetical protein